MSCVANISFSTATLLWQRFCERMSITGIMMVFYWTSKTIFQDSTRHSSTLFLTNYRGWRTGNAWNYGSEEYQCRRLDTQLQPWPCSVGSRFVWMETREMVIPTSACFDWRPHSWDLLQSVSCLKSFLFVGLYSSSVPRMTFLGGGRACMSVVYSLRMFCQLITAVVSNFHNLRWVRASGCRLNHDLSHVSTEVVLSVLLSRFRFSPSEKDIVWEMSTISIPTIKGHPRCPQLPLKISVLWQVIYILQLWILQFV